MKGLAISEDLHGMIGEAMRVLEEAIAGAGPEEAARIHGELGRLRDACLPRMLHEPPDRNLDAHEAARKLGISASNLYKKAKAGQLPFTVRVGGRLLFSERGIERWNRRMMGL